jgi:glutamate racemase
MIGFYDSGIGGQTILKEVKKRLPFLDTLYFGDVKNCPLGEKTDQHIYEIVKNGVQLLFEQGCNLVILACNTATAIAIRRLQNEWLPISYPDRKILGVIRPVSEELKELQIAKSDNICIMATPATINSGFYIDELNEYGFRNVSQIAVPGLALAIEQSNETEIKEVLKKVLKENQEIVPQIDVLVLACTHYPIALQQIASKIIENGGKKSLQIISQDYLVAVKLQEYLNRYPYLAQFNGIDRYF